DKIVPKNLPELKWSQDGGEWKRIRISSNFLRVIESPNPSDCFVRYYKNSGLFLCDLGLWIDECLNREYVKHSDGVERRWRTESETLLRFDRRKHIYFYHNTACRYLRYKQLL
ncbi:MAG TPA: hypothetical protein VJK03_00100, partial [Candidatus Nanoarchaeia archaeon]|nr:hypothetical protein [Candidatus Nanoarchaeia archaeon]